MSKHDLTVRGVNCRLTRAGVELEDMEIAGRAEVSRRVDFEYTGERRSRGVVNVRGSREARHEIFLVLFDSGLTVALYPDHDEWSRA